MRHDSSQASKKVKPVNRDSESAYYKRAVAGLKVAKLKKEADKSAKLLDECKISA